MGSLTESQRAIAGIGASNVMRTLVLHEDLLWPWLTLAGKLGPGGGLSPRDRELLILRVALRTECECEFAHNLEAFDFEARENSTEIEAQSPGKHQHVTKPGLDLIQVLTSKGQLSIAY
jgi:alkylhydroperoxidase family enzyme